MNLVGYSDRMVAAPGDTVRFMISSRHETFRAELVRVYHGDENPAGPGPREVVIDHPAAGDYPGLWQDIVSGSFIAVADATALAPESFTLWAWVWPTLLGTADQPVISKLDAGQLRGYGLFITQDGDVEFRYGDGTHAERVRTDTALRPRRWYLVAASYDASAAVACAHQIPLERRRTGEPLMSARRAARARPARTPIALLIAGSHTAAGPRGSFNGKIGSPQIAARALAIEEIEQRAHHIDRWTYPDLVAGWDFAADTAGRRVRDRGPHGLDGTVVNTPARAMTGWNWSGSALSHAHAPHEYGAIHFHDDDLSDAAWQPSIELSLPYEMPSGVYALRFHAEEDRDSIPFFVRPPAGHATADIALLLPTNSYLAYANFRGSDNTTVDEYVLSNRLLSLYDLHSDGSGACYSSSLRPNLTLRPDARLKLPHIEQPRGFPHQLAADLHLVDWLDRGGFAVDILTDDVLHTEGADLLRPYRVVLTGSHPEYSTGPMLDAFEDYLCAGGRMMYLGGNGLYWVTSISPSEPHVIEVRRVCGTRAWEAAPGEGYHSTTGEPGGLWRHRGRPPQRLVGVGFTAQGFAEGAPYRRPPNRRDPLSALVFAGLPEGRNIFGDHPSLVLGRGAAGFELDRADVALGTSPEAVVLASSTAADYSPSYQHVVEEVMMSDSRQAAPEAELVRSDLTLVPYPSGGAVFSVGSVAWCAALAYNEGVNDVSVITRNVLEAFLKLDELLGADGVG